MQNINHMLRYIPKPVGLKAVFVMQTIGLGALAWPTCLLASSGQPLAYVTNVNPNTVSVIDTGTKTLINTISVGTVPQGIAVAPDGKHVYVAILSDNKLLVIDTATNTVENTIGVGVGPEAVTVSPDGKRLYVANRDSNNVSVIDAGNYMLVDMIPVGNGPQAIALAPDGKYVYVANLGSNDISVIDTQVDKTVNTIAVGPAPAGIAITPDGKYAYVVNSAGIPSANVSVIDTHSNAVIATISAGDHPSSVAVTPDGKKVYVANFFSGDVSVIDTASNAVVATVAAAKFPSGPSGLAVTPDGTQVYIAGSPSNSISVVDTATNTLKTTVPAGVAAFQIGIIPPPQGVPFPNFKAELEIGSRGKPAQDTFDFSSELTVSDKIHLACERVKFQVGQFIATIPAGSFRRCEDSSSTYEGTISGVKLSVLIELKSASHYAFRAKARGANLTGLANPVQVSLSIGEGTGLAMVEVVNLASPLGP